MTTQKSERQRCCYCSQEACCEEFWSSVSWVGISASSRTQESQAEMDLWDVATNFLVVNVTGKHFKVTEILNLASSLKLQLKPPRNANSAQISFLVKDLIDGVKNQYNVLDLASAMCQVKPFEYLGSRLKDKLINESILCMNESFKLVYEQQHEMSR